MYSEAIDPRGSNGSYLTTKPETDIQPLTAEIMSRTGRIFSLAQDVNGRLYELRNRLFGEPPIAGSNQGEKARPINGFSDAIRDRSAELEALLVSICDLSLELANRI